MVKKITWFWQKKKKVEKPCLCPFCEVELSRIYNTIKPDYFLHCESCTKFFTSYAEMNRIRKDLEDAKKKKEELEGKGDIVYLH